MSCQHSRVSDDEQVTPEPDTSEVDEAAEAGSGGLVIDDPDGIIGNAATVVERHDDGLTYDCTEWSGESRALLDELLSSAGVRHAWQGTVLGVSPEDEAQVDALIDEVIASASAALDPERDKVVYEVAAWSAAMQSSVAESLTVADIPYEWDDAGDLVVYADDEDRVEEIFEQLPDPDDPELASDESVNVQDLLSALFVSAGDLARKPRDAAAVVGVADVAEQLEHLSLPFGFEPAVWKNLVGLATNLRDALVAEEGESALEDDELRTLAAELRDTLRRYV